MVISPSTNWSELGDRLHQDYGFDISLKYQDSDSDWITLSTAHDFEELISSGADTVSVSVAEAMLPNLTPRSPSTKIAPNFQSPSISMRSGQMSMAANGGLSFSQSHVSTSSLGFQNSEFMMSPGMYTS